MVNKTKVAHDIILKLAEETEKNVDLADPYIQKLLFELNSVALVSSSGNHNVPEYYSVKDVAELFDVNKQTVYKWIAEEKIDYKVDESPGKIQRKGYQIPKGQFQTEREMNIVDPTFSKRREKAMKDIPNTDSSQSDVSLPEHSHNSSISYDDIKHDLRKNK
ncbi:Helix-turn-helix domain-containing protein [Lentibacillus persicus]|uniref:Helix-turn-helix domain-containing protein n=1 Tax=Lentibacillus persicus TaxID=640948 RepID=A0A1I1SEM5_9BACI|nr:helix-turn-helix domain-containing protein [Lentibacillus persicus]SFD42293.1 Helix-turn-helix domain-containing protein [Lentibacillus persicus]